MNRSEFLGEVEKLESPIAEIYLSGIVFATKDTVFDMALAIIKHQHQAITELTSAVQAERHGY